MKTLIVSVEVRNVYGNKTLNLVDLQRIQGLGFEVAEVHSRKLPL